MKPINKKKNGMRIEPVFFHPSLVINAVTLGFILKESGLIGVSVSEHVRLVFVLLLRSIKMKLEETGRNRNSL